MPSNYTTLQNYTPILYECKLNSPYVRISCSHYSQIPVHKKGKIVIESYLDSSCQKKHLRSSNSTVYFTDEETGPRTVQQSQGHIVINKVQDKKWAP